MNAIERFPGQEPNQTVSENHRGIFIPEKDNFDVVKGFSLANGINDSMFDYLGKHPARAKRFANAMKAATAGQPQDSLHDIKSYSWASIGSGTVVDVGGSEGHISTALAESYPSLKFIVQDRPEVVSGAESKVPPGLQDRVTFMAHSFLEEQPVKADCYLFRRIFHNWPDSYCVQILRNLVPALQPGARIVINDNVMPEPNTLPILSERKVR